MPSRLSEEGNEAYGKAIEAHGRNYEANKMRIDYVLHLHLGLFRCRSP